MKNVHDNKFELKTHFEKENYQGGYQIAVIVAHHSDLLRLFQNLIDFFHAAIENDVGFG